MKHTRFAIVDWFLRWKEIMSLPVNFALWLYGFLNFENLFADFAEIIVNGRYHRKSKILLVRSPGTVKRAARLVSVAVGEVTPHALRLDFELKWRFTESDSQQRE